MCGVYLATPLKDSHPLVPNTCIRFSAVLVQGRLKSQPWSLRKAVWKGVGRVHLVTAIFMSIILLLNWQVWGSIWSCRACTLTIPGCAVCLETRRAERAPGFRDVVRCLHPSESSSVAPASHGARLTHYHHYSLTALKCTNLWSASFPFLSAM